MQGSDFSGVSQSTASAALALTALSTGAEDRKIIEPVVLKHSPPFIPAPPPTNVYQLPGITPLFIIVIITKIRQIVIINLLVDRCPVPHYSLQIEKLSGKRKLPKKYATT